MEPAIENSKQLDLSKLSEEEMRILKEKCEKGDPEVREQIILAYLPFVGSIAKNYINKGIPYEDLFQEGCYGLIDAVNHYKSDTNISFATYFYYYIKKYMTLALISQNSHNPIVCKERWYQEAHKYMQAYDKLYAQYNREPTDHELAKELKMTLKKIYMLRMTSHMFLNFPITYKPELLRQYPGSIISKSAEITFFEKQNAQGLYFLELNLTQLEREILSRRFGFTENGEYESIAEISASMGLSYAKIRNTCWNALKKIRDAIENNKIDIESISS